jgi:hypothetical protein
MRLHRPFRTVRYVSLVGEHRQSVWLTLSDIESSNYVNALASPRDNCVSLNILNLN